MLKQDPTLSSIIERLGFARNSQVKLYGFTFDLISSPIIIGNLALVDGIEKTSGKLRRVRIPNGILARAREAIPNRRSHSSRKLRGKDRKPAC